MPELPEVESLRRDLSRTIVGRTIVDVQLGVEKLFRGEPRALVGRCVEGLRRRGKFLIWELSGELALVIHLKLTGQLVHLDAQGQELAHGGHPVPMWGTPLPHKATHLTFRLDDGSVVYLTDIRQFARLALIPRRQVAEFLKQQRLGPEPLTRRFTARDFAAKLARRGIPVKTVLLDQSVIGGVGNIYADEALWAARIHPRRPADSLAPEEVARLHRAVRSVLAYAVEEGVAFVPMGRAISDRAFPYAHGRAGSPCPRHKRPSLIVKEFVGGRGTFYCPRCQHA